MVDEEQAAWYAIYEADSGRLISVATEVADPLPEGLDVAAVDGPQLLRAWDPATHAFVEAQPESVAAEEDRPGRRR